MVIKSAGKEYKFKELVTGDLKKWFAAVNSVLSVKFPDKKRFETEY